MWLKKLKAPITNEVKEIDVVQMWEVRWMSRYGEYAAQTKPELECFTSEPAANEFAEALRGAFKLIRHTNGDSVTVKKYENKN